jgi:hypothetical protein
MRGFAQKLHTSLNIVEHGDVAVFVASVDVRQLDSRTAVTAVKDDEESAVGRQGCNEGAMKNSAGDLAVSYQFVLERFVALEYQRQGTCFRSHMGPGISRQRLLRVADAGQPYNSVVKSRNTDAAGIFNLRLY